MLMYLTFRFSLKSMFLQGAARKWRRRHARPEQGSHQFGLARRGTWLHGYTGTFSQSCMGKGSRVQYMRTAIGALISRPQGALPRDAVGGVVG